MAKHAEDIIVDKKDQLEKIEDYCLSNETIRAVFDLKGGVYLKAGNRNFIEIFEGGKTNERGYILHFCLEVDDIKATVKDLREKGIEASDVTMGEDNSYQAWITDPDGYRFELHEYTPQSKQRHGFQI